MRIDRSWARIRDVDLYVVSLGAQKGIPLVVIHGGPDWDHSYLLRPINQLATARRIVLFDIRGCGRSTRGLPSRAYQPVEVAKDLDVLTGSLGVPQVDVLGFSYGGRLAVRFLADHGERVRRLVLASTSIYEVDDGALLPWSAYRGPIPDPDVHEVLNDPSLDAQHKTERLAEVTAQLDIWDLRRLPEYRRLLKRIRFSGEWMKAWQSGELSSPLPANAEEVLRDWGGPTCLLHGAHDMRFPVEHARRLHRAVPRTHLAVIGDAGHMAHFEQPVRWADQLHRFLQ